MDEQPDTGKQKIGEKEYEMKTYFMAFLKRGENWTPETTDEVMKIQEAHLAHIGKMVEDKKLAIAGPFLDDGDLRGIFIFNTETQEEAEKLCAQDPAVKAGRLEVEIHPWYSAKGSTLP